MNLLFFTQMFYPFVFGGGEYVFFLMARELVKRGHNANVITQRFHGTKPIEIVNGIRIFRIGEETVYTGTLPSTIKHNLGYLIHAVIKGREIIGESKRNAQPIDIIHSNTYVPALCGQICSSLHNIPHVITFHDVYQASSNKFWAEWISKQNAALPFYASFMSKFIEKIILRLPASMFHTVSDATREDLVRFGICGSKITVIPNGLDLSDYRYQHNDQTDRHNIMPKEVGPTAVFIGRLVFYKNIETIIKAFKNVVKIIPHARLIIIGDGPDKDNLVKEAECIRNEVIFTGRISHSEKIKLIAESSLIAFPSLIEGFGITIIEGFACGKPVLVSNVRPQCEIVKDGYSGYIIPPFDVDSWANKVVELFNDKAKQIEMGKKAYQEFLSNYEITKVVSRIETLYKDVMSCGNKG